MARVVLGYDRSVSLNLFCKALGICLLVMLPLAPVSAGFSSMVPLRWGGSVSYSYGYVTAITASERMQILGNVNARGYLWQPWFASISAALNLSLAKAQSTTSSNDSNAVTGSFAFSLFPNSRFPLSLVYTRSDSRTASFSDLAQLTGSTYHQLSRLSLRQVYRSRGGSSSNFWYYRSNFSGSIVSSLAETYGATYQVRSAPNTLGLSASYNVSGATDRTEKPSTTVFSLNHIYTPGPSNGVINLVSYLNADSGSGSGTTLGQASSSFYWRPEHRSASVSGGVRASKSDAIGGTAASRRSFDTNIGLNYRLTRRSSLTAGISMGSAESNGSQSLITSQSLGLNYSSNRFPLFAGFDWMWQTSGSAGSTLTRIDSKKDRISESVQNAGVGLSHNLSGRWTLGRTGSLNMGFSQSLSGSRSSSITEVVMALNNSFNMSSSVRGARGTTYGSFQLSDSRSQGGTDSMFQRASVSLNQDLALTRLSSLSGSSSFVANRQAFQVPAGGVESGYRRYAQLTMFYRHDRPFGVYSLQFNSRFNGSKEIGNGIPWQRLDWNNRFRYRLGLLSMSAGFRLIQSSSGVSAKSLNFQATRSF